MSMLRHATPATLHPVALAQRHSTRARYGAPAVCRSRALSRYTPRCRATRRTPHHMINRRARRGKEHAGIMKRRAARINDIHNVVYGAA